VPDLPYILTHPLLQKINRHCAELEEQACALPEGSRERKAIKKRIGKLQEYGLPKPDTKDLEQTEPLVDRTGQTIGERHSIRRRYVEKRRGRPAQWRVRVRAAQEEKISNPKVTWSELAEKCGFKPRWRMSEDGKKMLAPGRIDLECQARLFRKLLREEGLELPTAEDYRAAENEFRRALAIIDAQQTLNPFGID
jgi:hypothetical protein